MRPLDGGCVLHNLPSVLSNCPYLTLLWLLFALCLGSPIKATDLYNAELQAFSTGEEATYQIQSALNGLGRKVFSLSGLYHKAEQNPPQ